MSAIESARREGRTGADLHHAVLRLADYLLYYLGAVAVAQYSQAVYMGQIEADPTLNRSLRSLRRVLPGQWLLWAGRSLEATPDGPVLGLAGWYLDRREGEIAASYNALRDMMVDRLGYTGEYGPQEKASPRLLLELVDQYRIRRGKAFEGAGSEQDLADLDAQVARALLPGLQAMLDEADFLMEYQLYAPQQRRLLMGPEPITPMPPMPTPPDTEATLLLYPPGEIPDYTKRPDLQSERLPLFPLDPLLVYTRCSQCDRHRVAALREVAGGAPSYLGLDPECEHNI